MHVQIHSDSNIEVSESLTVQVEATVESTLNRFREQITRIEVHLSDENSHKSRGPDKKCVMEARPAGLQPLAVTHRAESLDQAVDGAAEKLEKLLESKIGRLSQRKGRTPYGGDPDAT